MSRIRVAVVSLALLLPIIAVGGCSADKIFIRAVAWLDDGWVYAIDDRLDTSNQLVRFTADSEAAPVRFAPAGCDAPSVLALARIARGRLAVAASCAGRVGNGLFTYDPASRSARQFGWIDRGGVEDLAVTSDLRLGYLARAERGLCWSVGQIRGGKEVAFPTPITVDGTTWPIGHGDAGGSATCPGTGDTRSPAMAEAGDAVYFAASGAAAEDDSTTRRFESASSLVRIAQRDGPATVVATGFQVVLDVAVAPDGQLVAMTAKRGGPASVWLVDPAAGRVSELRVPDAAWLSFAPDGRRVVVVSAAGEPSFHQL